MCKWIVDADLLQGSDFNKDLLYRTDVVDSFIMNDHKLGIKAPKGLGKTFLLKCKRMESQKSGVICLPRDSMLDIMERIIPSDSMYRYLLDYANWVDLWQISICIALIKAVIPNVVNYQWQQLIQNNTLLRNMMSNELIVSACQAMNYLVNSDRSLVRDTQKSIPELMSIVKTIRQPVHLFIDKTDQALRDQIQISLGSSSMSHGPNNKLLWIYGQLSLAEAAYKHLVQNPHVKVYFGIRSEVFSDAMSITDIYLQVASYIVDLDYSFFDLKGMFEHYVSIEDDKWLVIPNLRNEDAAQAFIGLNKIRHGYVTEVDQSPVFEAFFPYMYRHTLKRPRDIMHICYRLCYSQIKLNENKERVVRLIVNGESRMLLQSYMREIGPFVFDQHPKAWDLLWRTIDTNVFTLCYAKDICCRINESLDPNYICKKECLSCPCFKPFSTLYNAGLLGQLVRNHIGGEMPTINFKSTGNIIHNLTEDGLPNSDLYFLHPMLTNKIEACRNDNNLKFDICTSFIVGDDLPIDNEMVWRIRRNEEDARNLEHRRRIFLSSTCHDLHDCRMLIYSELGRYDYHVVMSEKNSFLLPDSDISSYDYCLDNVSRCSQLIFVIGERYGCEYKGSKYTQIANEITQLNSKIDIPSISLMEFYLAKKLGIQTYVFTRKEIYNERITYEKNKDRFDFTPAFVKDKRVFEIINLITRLDTGNWFKCYEDVRDLLEIIRIQFGGHGHQE